ncbi:HAD domain-containing protein [Thalassospira xiamenensis]|uniref:Phosphatase n=1 Tax=Thalassospira xiamenensis TaxID=220697 RepID=A0A285TRH5_9PROT|nr:HAD domain-containing protein [Thalassospira xiamenensis]SOC26205.1 hypothetical protein SAMN05428964_10579 [Thalassospira xiamenensis]
MRKALYFDIDGVLNDSKHPSLHDIADIKELSPGNYVLVKILNMFRQFVVRHGLDLVVVSSWCTRHTVGDIADFLGVSITGKADYTGGGLSRGDAVSLHAAQNGYDTYAIVDDAGSKCYRHLNRLVAPCGAQGLSERDLKSLERILSAQDFMQKRY